MSMHAPTDGLTPPKRPRTLATPTGTPSRETHSASFWGPTPSSATRSAPATPTPVSAGAMLSSATGLMQMPPPPSPASFMAMPPMMSAAAPYGAMQYPSMAGYQQPWQQYPAPKFEDMSPSEQKALVSGIPPPRRRRKTRTRASQLTPKVMRPPQVAGGADKWKHLSKKERERARRSELKQCYNDLSHCLDLSTKRSGAQLPDRSDIVRAACEEIRRLERQLGGVQLGLKDQVKASVV